jgi:quercetin dioxygenase-like cupin family protein
MEGQKLKLSRWDPSWGPMSDRAMSERLQEGGYSISKYHYPPGTHFPLHTHAEDKVDSVLEGKLKISWDGGSAVLEAGDMIEIPAGTRHSAEVVGTVTVISLDAVKVR